MPPRRQPMLVRWLAMIRRNPWKSIATALAILGGIPGAWAGAQFFEPAVPASRSYVRDLVHVAQNSVLPVLRDLQIETAEGKRDAAETAIDRFNLELNRAQTDDERMKINRAIRDQINTRDKLNGQIKTLNNLKSGQ